MPKGKPNTQTKATEKYQRKAGMVSKSFKLKRELVLQFVEQCEKQGVSQASVITQFMNEFLEKK